MIFEDLDNFLQRVLLTEIYPSMNAAQREQRGGERIPGEALTKNVKRRRQETNDPKSCMTMLLCAVVGARVVDKGLSYLLFIMVRSLTSLKLVKVP